MSEGHPPGMRFLHTLSPLPPGLRILPEQTFHLPCLAVETRASPLVEIEDGSRLFPGMASQETVPGRRRAGLNT